MKSYWQRLSPGIVGSLVKAMRFVADNKINKFHIYDDLKLDYRLSTVEQMNWTKLRFHGLVAKHKIDGVWQRGYWVITTRGFNFLYGRLSVPYSVRTFRNRVVEHSARFVTIRDVLGELPYFDSEFDYQLMPGKTDD